MGDRAYVVCICGTGMPFVVCGTVTCIIQTYNHFFFVIGEINAENVLQKCT